MADSLTGKERPEAPAQSAPPVEGGRMEPLKVRSDVYAIRVWLRTKTATG